MMTRSSARHVAAVAAAFAAVAGVAPAQTPVGSNIDSRLIVAFDVADAGVQGWMPEGWTSAPFSGGPFAGADLLVVMIDQHVARDAAGETLSPPAAQRMALAAPATNGTEQRLFVLRIYTDPRGSDPYGNSVPAAIGRQASWTAPSGGPRRASQTWTVRLDAGETLTLSVEHAPGAPAWGTGALQPYSAADPDFSRLYSFEQLTDLAMSAPLGKPLDGAAKLESDIAELAAMFDGAQTLVGVLDTPLYVREVSLPRDLRQTPRRIP